MGNAKCGVKQRCALIVQMANCKWQVANFGTLRVDFILS